MSEDGISISRKTWCRSIEPLNKLGYMDGASDGQATAFQSSFDLGYQQGFSFGLQLGLNRFISPLGHSNDVIIDVTDPRKINCQVCLSNTTTKDSVTNLYNSQQEKNIALLNNTQM